MISVNGGLPAHRYTPQVTPRWPRGSEPASVGDMYSHVWMWPFELGIGLPCIKLYGQRSVCVLPSVLLVMHINVLIF